MPNIIRSERRSAEGFTLIEMIISIAILGVVFSVMSAVVLASFRTNHETTARLTETRDEQFAASYFAGDASGATAMAAGGGASCGTGPAVVEFLGTSFDTATPPGLTKTAASYVFSTSTVDGVLTGRLTRYDCSTAAGSATYGTPTPSTGVVVSRTLATSTPVVTCFTPATPSTTSCGAGSSTVRATFARLSGGTPFVLSGARRTTS